jgi:hypothetical protein
MAHLADRTPELRELAAAAGYTALRAFRGRKGYDVELGEAPSRPEPPASEQGPDVTDSKSVP